VAYLQGKKKNREGEERRKRKANETFGSPEEEEGDLGKKKKEWTLKRIGGKKDVRTTILVKSKRKRAKRVSNPKPNDIRMPEKRGEKETAGKKRSKKVETVAETRQKMAGAGCGERGKRKGKTGGRSRGWSDACKGTDEGKGPSD